MLLLALVLGAQFFGTTVAMAQSQESVEKVGVLYVVHGAGRTQNFSHFFDARIQMASYDPNSSTYKNTIWQPESWPKVVPIASGAQAATLLGLYRKSRLKVEAIRYRTTQRMPPYTPMK